LILININTQKDKDIVSMTNKKEIWHGINRKNIDWFPTVDYSKCTGCLACIKKCTRGVYAVKKGKPVVVSLTNCAVGCTGCDVICPARAISHQPKKSLAKFIGKNTCGCNCKGESS
jgi:NAD-dependent dihydropyrimidine dehydrogenase PreA subunit